MKLIKLSTKTISHLSREPMIIVSGSNQQYKSRLMNHILSDQNFYSQKFGRILYIGQRKYKSPKIQQDQQNWFQKITYQDLMDKIDDAKVSKIINLLLVFNTKYSKDYQYLIQNILSLRKTYLLGQISILVNLTSVKDYKPSTIQSFNTFFMFDDEIQVLKLAKIKDYSQKRKKDVYVISQNQITVWTELKD